MVLVCTFKASLSKHFRIAEIKSPHYFQLQPKSHNHPLPKHTTTANKQCSLFINYGHLGIDLERVII